MIRLVIRPAVPGMVIRHPHNKRPLSDDGEIVQSNITYWTRRIRSGDVVPIEDDEQ